MFMIDAKAAKQAHSEVTGRNGYSCWKKLLSGCYTTSNERTGSCRVSSKSTTNTLAAIQQSQV